jgi:hypothetical protein
MASKNETQLTVAEAVAEHILIKKEEEMTRSHLDEEKDEQQDLEHTTKTQVEVQNDYPLEEPTEIKFARDTIVTEDELG